MSYTHILTDNLDECNIPACNIQQFVISNPFSPNSTVLRSLKSPVNGPTVPLIHPNRPLFYDSQTETTITHQVLSSTSLRLANGIQARYGVPKLTDSFGCDSLTAPVALVHLPNCAVWPIIAFGLWAAGWTVTPTNSANTSSELAHIVGLCRPKLIISQAGESYDRTVREGCAGAGHVDFDLYFVDPSVPFDHRRSRPENAQSWLSLLSEQELKVEPMSPKEANRRVALILWTSGTTGKPKGAMLSHRALVACVIIMWSGLQGYDNEICLGVPPFYHILGLYHLILMPPAMSSTVILIGKFTPENLLRAISEFKITRLHIAPPVALVFANSNLIDQPWCSLKSLKSGMSGGAPLAAEVVRKVYKRTGIVIKIGYGMTEAGPLSDFADRTWQDIEPALNSTGFPLYAVETTILGPQGERMPRNAPGEIILRSPGQMIGYVKNRQATEEVISELGIHTGDLGYLDDAGRIVIVGRQKELIKYKGYQVSPSELESVIATVQDIQDVAVASVYADSEATELPLAYVVPRNPSLLPRSNDHNGAVSKDIRELAHKVQSAVNKNCIHYKRLRGGVKIVDSIPKNPSGKILRASLKNLQGIHVDYNLARGANSERAKL